MQTFIKEISDQPITGIKRQVKFLRFDKFDLNDSVPLIKAEFAIMHSINGISLNQLDKSIFLTADGNSMLPIDLDLDNDGNLSGYESEIVDDMTFTTNWLWNNKGLKGLYDLMFYLKDIKKYNGEGIEYDPNDVEHNQDHFIYSYIDLKYSGVFK